MNSSGSGSGGMAPIVEITADDVSETLPSTLINPMSIWSITLPIQDPASAGKPQSILQPALLTATAPPWYYVSTSNEVVFRATCACDDAALLAGRPDCGYHTATSSYARSELRELAAWSTSVGEHIMETDVTITRAAQTGTKPDVAVNQIHDETDDIVLVRLRASQGPRLDFMGNTICATGCTAPLVVEGSELGVDGKPTGQGTSVWYTVLDPAYVIGTPFKTRIHAHSGQVDVYFASGDDPLALAVTVPANTTGCYFKAGAYNHSGMKPDKGMCSLGDYAESRFSRIEVTHAD